MSQTLSFTARYPQRVNVLKTPVKVSKAFDVATPPKTSSFKIFSAIWDTGATHSVITDRVATECSLIPFSMTQVQTAAGITNCEVYYASIILRNDVTFPKIRVTKGNIGVGADVLIGMDIINKGDFAVTNRGGKTVFSFRMPSIVDIDFVKQGEAVSQRSNTIKYEKVGRNQSCPCGSGKKYKKCHGK